MNVADVPSLFSAASPAAGNRSSNAPVAHPPPQQQQSANTATDTVHLTEAQQVYQLYNQGQKVSQIATSLSLTASAVDSYLNISKAG